MELFYKMKKGFFLIAVCLVCIGQTMAQNVLFVKSGVTDGDVITVGSETGAAYTTLKEAVAHSTAGDIVKLTEDVTEAGTVSNSYGPCCVKLNGITIDGCGHKLRVTGMSGSYACSIYLMKGTVQNLDVSGGFRTLFSGGVSGDIVIDNCIVNAGGEAAYPFNTDAANINYSVTITNSTLYGWCSYTGDFKSVTISNTTFAQGATSYAFFRPYSPTVLENVTFDNSGSKGYAVDARQDRIIFNDCNVGGVQVNTENIASLLGANSTSKAIIVEGTYETNAEGEITGGIYGGNLDQLNQVLAPGHVAVPLGTDPETYRVTPVYYVHFNAGGGTGTQGDSIVLQTAPTFTVPANTEFSYGTYTFQSWNSKIYGAGTDIAVGSTMTLTSDTTLYAKWNLDFVAKIGSTTYSSLQAAVDDAYDNMTGDVTIELVANIEAYTVVRQKEGLNLTIDGGDMTINGQILIDGGGDLNANTLLITGINFTGNGTTTGFTSKYFISIPAPAELPSPYTVSRLSDAHNITVDNCTFNSTSTETPDEGLAAVYTGSGTQCNNIIVQNCTGTNLHSIVQVSGLTGLTVDGCTLTNCESFIGIQGGSGTYTVQNCDFATTLSSGYGIRSKSSSSAEITLSNNVFSAPDANVLQLGKGSGQNSTGSIHVVSGEYYGNIVNAQSTDAVATFVITGGTYSEPKATVDGYCAYGYAAVANDPSEGYCTVRKLEVARIGTTTYPSLQDAVDSANEMTGDVTIELLKNTSEIVTILQKETSNITIDGNGDTLTGQIFISNRQENPAFTGSGSSDSHQITITNLDLKYDANYYNNYGSASESGLIYFCKNCAFGNVLNYSHNITISNCNFDADGSNKEVYAISSIAGTVYNLNIDNCTAKNAAGLATLQSAPEFEVTNCSTEDVLYGLRIVNNGGPMTVSNNTFEAEDAGIYVCYMTTGATINFAEDTISAPVAFQLDATATSGTLDITGGRYIGAFEDNSTTDFFNISGGTYSENVTGERCATGYAAFANGTTPETWTVYPAATVHFDANGGTGTMADTIVKKDESYTIPACTFTHPMGYLFISWKDNINTSYAVGDNINITKDTTLTVQWGCIHNATQDIIYGDIQAAIDAANPHDSLVLLTNVDYGDPFAGTTTTDILTVAADDDIILDFNGHTISASASEYKNSFILRNNGTLNLTDHTVDDATADYANGAGGGFVFTTSVAENNYSTQTTAISNNGTLNIKSGRVYANNTLTSNRNLTYGIFAAAGGTLNLYGGYVRGRTAGIYHGAFNGTSTVNIHGGTVTSANSGIQTKMYGNVVLNIDGGTVTSDNTHAIYCSDGNAAYTQTINISGGTITAGGEGFGIENFFANSTINISGGQITGAHGIYEYPNYGGSTTSSSTYNITGGTITATNAAALIRSRYPSHITIDQDAVIEGYVYASEYVGGAWAENQTDYFTLKGGCYSEDPIDYVALPYAVSLGNPNCQTGYYSIEKTYVLRYEANGGTGTMMNDTVLANHPDITVKECGFTREGYAFVRWNTKADGMGVNFTPGSPLTLTQDTTLYAQWGRVLNATQGTIYDDLQSAIDAASANDSLVVLTDLTITQTSDAGVLNVEKSLIINGAKHTITTSARRGLWVNASDVNLTLRNLDLDCINASEEYVRGIQINGNSNVNLVIDSCRLTTASLQGKSYALNFPCSCNHFNVTVKNSYMKGWAVVNSFAHNTHFIFENDTLHGVNQLSTTQWDDFATINLDGGSNNSCGGVGTGSSDVIVDITNSVVIAEKQGTCTQNWINISYGARNVNINVDCNTKFVDGPAAGANDISEKLFISSLDNFTNDYTRGSTGAIVVKLNSTQMDALVDDDYTLKTVTDDCEKVRVSHSAYYTYSEGNVKEYIDFNAIFTDHRLDADEQIDLLEDVTLTADLYVPFTGNFTIHFTDGSDVHSITQGDYSIALDDDQTCTTDKQVAGLFTAFSGSDIIETNNGDNTYTYSVAPYYTIDYYSNNSADEFDSQVRPHGETVYLKDYTTFDHADSTIYRWNTQADGNGTDYALGAAYNEDADIELYAVWRLNLNMTMDSTDVVCYGENNGTDTVKMIGGDTPFQLVLSGTALSENDTVRNIMDRTYIFENLKPGDYTVTLTDVLGKDTITGNFTIDQPDTLVASFVSVPVAPCPLMGTGNYEVAMTSTGGNGGNVYTWGGDATDVNDTATVVVPDEDDRDRTYNITVTVTDQKGCTAVIDTNFTVSPVIANDGTAHSNTVMTIDTINQSILYGCDTIIRDFGTPHFTFSNSDITENILDTIYNNVSTAFPDSIFTLGENKIIWTAVDTCGHEVTAEQVITITHKPCPSAYDYHGIEYPAVRIGCDCWTAKNLASTQYSDGDAIPDVMSYPINTRASVFGNLYTYDAAMDGADVAAAIASNTPVQGACPQGWHIPSQAESEALMNSADVRDLMSQGTWIPDNGTNSTGYNMLPGGFYNSELNRYERMYVSAYFWIATPPTYIYHVCEFGAACSSLEFIPGTLTDGYSIRCVMTDPNE